MSISRAIRRRLDRRWRAARVNFGCHVTEGALGGSGQEMAGRTVFAVMVEAMVGGAIAPLMVGVLNSIRSFSFVGPILLAPRLEAVRRKKRLVLLLGLAKRLPLFLIAVAIFLLANKHPIQCLLLIGLARLVSLSCDFLTNPVYMDLIAETLPVGRLSRMFGFRNFFSSLLRIASVSVAAAIIAGVAQPANFALVYLLSFLVMMLSWGVFSLVDEVGPSARTKPRQCARHYFRELAAAFRRDRSYRNYLLFQAAGKGYDEIAVFFVLAGMALHGISRPEVVLVAGIAATVTSMVGNPLIPFVAERLGLKLVLAGSALLRVGGAVAVVLAPSWEWFVLAFVLNGAARAAHGVATPAFDMLLYPPSKRVGYITLADAAMAPVRLLAAPLAGGLVLWVGDYRPLFVVIAVLTAAALWPLARCRPSAPSEDGEQDAARR